MTTTIRTSDPRDLLALVPYQLGFVPRESAVLLSIRRRRARVGLVARVDLADLAHPEHGPGLARSLVAHLVDDGASRAVLVLWTDEPLPAAGRPVSGGPVVGARAAREHVVLAAEHLLGTVDCWVVGPTGYREIDCADPGCCPPQGRPLSDLQASAVSAEMVLRGERPADSRDTLVQLPVVTGECRRSARRAAQRTRRRRERVPDEAGLRAWRRDGLALWRALASAPASTDGAEAAVRVGPVACGRLAAALEDVLVRDAVLVSLVPGNEDVADALVSGDAGADVDRALRVLADPVDGRPPREETVGPCRRTLELVSAHCAGGAHPPSLTLLALLAWWSGDGARAGVLVERALDVDGSYRLAVLLRQTLEAAMPPGWVVARRGEDCGTSVPGRRRAGGTSGRGAAAGIG